MRKSAASEALMIVAHAFRKTEWQQDARCLRVVSTAAKQIQNLSAAGIWIVSLPSQ
jgi:hypothetical protein